MGIPAFPRGGSDMLLCLMQVDVTEIFRQIPHEKKVRMVSLLVYLCTFVITIYKCARLADIVKLQYACMLLLPLLCACIMC